MREALGELTLVTSEQMTAAVQQVDEVLKVNPSDRLHLFYEQMKDFLFALGGIEPDDIDYATIDLLVRPADEPMEVMYAIQRRRKERKIGCEK